MKEKVILQTNFPKLKFFKRGKVRDIYDLEDYFLIISTDRLSAFDVIMAQGIPYKGKVLTKISEFWFDYSKSIIKNHLVTTDVNKFPKVCLEYAEDLSGRSMLVKKAEVVPIESVVRGYITGSGWNDYKKTGEVCGIKLPAGMLESEKFTETLFTPATKAEIGLHDENISEAKAKEIAGIETISFVKQKSIEVYNNAFKYAKGKGIIIADTKMEFGKIGNEIILIDELLTPDSSRFWPLDKYQKGKSQESFDKQFVRDYLISIKFNKQPPPPPLPENIIRKTSEKYLEALEMVTGERIN
jgi:phosphoribosylaminoimidazole-succinocarboxamide synthase